MTLLEKLKRNQKPEPVKVDGETFYVSRMSAKDKDRFDLHWADYRAANGDSGVGLRGFLVAFCLCDQSGKKTYCSGNGTSAAKGFVEVAEQIMDGDANAVEPLFEAAGKINGIIKDDSAPN